MAFTHSDNPAGNTQTMNEDVPLMQPWLKRAWPAFALLLLGFVICVVEMAGKAPNPWSDEVDYLNIGRAIAETGHYASSAEHPTIDTSPGREPMYPLVVAVVMRLDSTLHDSAAHCIGNDQDLACPSIYRSLRWVNALFCGLAAALAFLTARRLGLGPAQCWVAGLYLALNFTLLKQARYIISDYLALALAGGLALALAWAMERPRSFSRWLTVGVAIGMLVLTKAIFELYAGLILLALAGLWAIRRNRGAGTAFLAVFLSLAVLVGGWVGRNWLVYGSPQLTDTRGGSALSQREALDHMTAGEYGASFLWWMRGPGAGLARQWLPEQDWHRHEWYAEDGFFNTGFRVNWNSRVEKLMSERGMDRDHAESAAGDVVVREIIAEWPMHLAVTVPVFYRGLWFDEFIVIGFPAFVYLLVTGLRRRAWPWLITASPALFSLVFYALLSINLTRYQFTAANGIALAGGVAIVAIWTRLRTRLARRHAESP